MSRNIVKDYIDYNRKDLLEYFKLTFNDEEANNDEEAEEFVLTGDYDEIISDSEVGDMEYEVMDIEQV